MKSKIIFDPTQERDPLTNKIIGCAIELHKNLGPGLLESAYEQCLAYELSNADLTFTIQEFLPINYKGIVLNCGYRVDFIIQKTILLEIKSVVDIIKIHEAQTLTYMRLSGIKTGLLVNFNVPYLKQGVRRLFL